MTNVCRGVCLMLATLSTVVLMTVPAGATSEHRRMHIERIFVRSIEGSSYHRVVCPDEVRWANLDDASRARWHSYHQGRGHHPVGGDRCYAAR